MTTLARNIRIYVFILTTGLLAACNSSQQTGKRFEVLSGETIGLDFQNTIVENDSLNAYIYYSMYNGGGVAAGDINNDGLTDLFFTGNQVSCRMFINKGDLKFEDITEQAGLLTDRWCRGVTMVDINADGYLDIYVAVADRNYSEKGRNLLFINNGNNSFTESAASYRVDDPFYSTTGVFFDYDLDGDLDLYVLNNGMEDFSPDWPRPRKLDGSGISNDRLYRNNGNLTFTDVTFEAGILAEGYGLGIGITDVNNDQWPDIYCSNDFISNDLLYVNNRDGTFTESLASYFDHTSYNGMGMDIADINNDALADIYVLDMRPESNLHLKTMIKGPNTDRIAKMKFFDYMPQFVRNTLQLNNGQGSFSEIGRLAGVYTTDWSWAALFADLDNDGYKDLFVTTGYGRDVTDLDYIDYFDRNYEFGTYQKNTGERFDMLMTLPGIDVHNYLFRNTGSLRFEDMSGIWDEKKNSLSNGAVYADLDADGDLDLVTSNINNYPGVYINTTADIEAPIDNHYLQIVLRGDSLNPGGIGTRLYLRTGDRIQFQEHYVSRGYKSSVEEVIHFGLGKDTLVNELSLVWPRGQVQILCNITADQRIHVKYDPSLTERPPAGYPFHHISDGEKVFLPVDSLGFQTFRHVENEFTDFHIQPLLMQRTSRDGPGMAVADVDGNGLEDVYIGNAYGAEGQLWLQTCNAIFKPTKLEASSRIYEDMGALFFDADGDNDPDLYLVSGGNHIPAGIVRDSLYRDRLFINDGNGRFTGNEEALPEARNSGSCVTASDYDLDGDLDLFVGTRQIPFQYPLPANSMLLRNDGGRFTDVTDQILPALKGCGLVKAALWTDYDNDGWQDLMIAGEWMPIRIFRNREGSFTETTNISGLENYPGFWNSLAAGDFDRDGDMDYIAGNLGLNSHLKASRTEPLEMMAMDFDNNGIVDPIIGFYLQGKLYPAHGKDVLLEQISSWERKFQDYRSYAEIEYDEIFTVEEMQNTYHTRITCTQSSYIENLGNGTFQVRPLPVEAQFAPIFGMLVEDMDYDGFLDVILSGNMNATELEVGYIDACKGLFLKGDGKGNFTPVPGWQSGFNTSGDMRSMGKIQLKSDALYLIASNSGGLKAYRSAVSHSGSFFYPESMDAWALLHFKDGRKSKHEFMYGSGYLSGSSRVMSIPPDIRFIDIYNYNGDLRIHLEPDQNLKTHSNSYSGH